MAGRKLNQGIEGCELDGPADRGCLQRATVGAGSMDSDHAFADAINVYTKIYRPNNKKKVG